MPSIDKSLQMDLYKDHKFPALHPELDVQISYILEGYCSAVSRYGLYTASPNEHDIQICMVTHDQSGTVPMESLK